MQSKTNDFGVYRQIYIGFREKATDGFQNEQDGKRRPSIGNTYFYSIIPNDDGRFGIQNLATFNDTKTIDLGVEINDAEVYTITIDHTEGIFNSQQNIYLKDYKTNILRNLSQDSYVFTVTKIELGEINDRFELRFTDEKPGIDEAVSNIINIYPNPSQNIFNISWKGLANTHIKVYDLTGKLVAIKEAKPNSNTYQLDLSAYSKGIYLARIEIDGQQVVKKLVLK